MENDSVKSKILSFLNVIFHFDIYIFHLRWLSFSILIFAFYILALPWEASAALISKPPTNLGLSE